MKTIQITLPEELLTKVDKAVEETGSNRSAFARTAFEDAIFRMWVEKMERLDAEGYARIPQDEEEIALWESVQVLGIEPGEWADYPTGDSK